MIRHYLGSKARPKVGLTKYAQVDLPRGLALQSRHKCRLCLRPHGCLRMTGPYLDLLDILAQVSRELHVGPDQGCDMFFLP